jgi:hypothetical protein
MSCAGLPADGTIAAEVAFMFNEWYSPNCCLEFPKGGSQAIVQALIRQDPAKQYAWDAFRKCGAFAWLCICHC